MAITDKVVTKARLQDYTNSLKTYVADSIADKVDKVSGKGLSTEDFTTALKNKLDGIETGANKITVDSALSSSSTNPVQNKAVNTALSNKVDKVSGKGLSTNDFTTTLKNKLDGIAEGATAVTVDSAMSATSTNPVQNAVVQTALDTKVDKVDGKQLSTEDFTTTLKNKLDGIATGANKTTVDSSLSSTSANPVQNKVVNTALGNKVDKVSGKGLSTEDFTTALKTKLEGIDMSTKVDVETGKGLSTEDFTTALKTKLEGIATGANNITVDSALSSTSTNPVQNSVINTALGNKVDKVSGKQLSTEDFTTTLKNKLDGIATGATKITVDSSLSSSSTNPVQNKVVNTALSGKLPAANGFATNLSVDQSITLYKNSTYEVKLKAGDVKFVGGGSGSDGSFDVGVGSGGGASIISVPICDGTLALMSDVDTKVDKVEGKQLSTEDFTTTLKNKLDGIAAGATKITVDSSLSSSSTNPVQNKVVNTALGNKVDKVSGKGLSTEDFTTTLKNKLDGIAAGATAVTVDSALSSTSTNPVQNTVINSALGGKVDKVSGKGLSANDFTTTLKNKLDGIAEGAQVNVIESIKVNNSALTVTSKAVNITVPTAVSALTNDSGYQTASQVSTAIATAIGNVNHFGFSIVSALPDKSAANTYTIYLVSKGTTATGNDVYTEYALINGNWEIIGDTDVDLSGYVKTTDLVEITKAEVEAMFA